MMKVMGIEVLDEIRPEEGLLQHRSEQEKKIDEEIKSIITDFPKVQVLKLCFISTVLTQYFLF